MSDLYETGILEWSQHQAALPRRLAAGDQVDWKNVIDEVESVGKEQVHAVSLLLLQAMAHRLKAIGWPDSRDAENWQAVARLFCAQAADRFAPSMRKKLNLARIYHRARRALPAAMDGLPPQPLPDECPWTLDDLLAEP